MQLPTRIGLIVILLPLLCGQAALAQEPIVKVSFRVALASQKLFSFGPLELSTPALTADGLRLVVGTAKGDLFVVDATNAKVMAHTELVGGVMAAPLVREGYVVVGTNDGRLYRLHDRTLAPLWPKPVSLQGAVVVSPTLVGQTLYVLDDRSVLLALDLETGEQVAAYDGQSFSRRGLSPFTIFGYPDLAVSRGMMVAGFETGTVARFDLPQSGRVEGFTPAWEVGICGAGAIKTTDEAGQARLCSPRRVFRDVDASPTLTPSGVLSGCYCRGLVMLDPGDGKLLWERPILGPSSPVVMGNHALMAAADGSLYAVALSTGRIAWQTRLEARLLSRPGIIGAASDMASAVAVVATGDALYFVNGSDGSIAARMDSLGGIAAAPLVVGNAVFILSNEGYLYRLDYFR
jgi:outer membrane protein assembly factor BamB